jgi:hypothetical protein
MTSLPDGFDEKDFEDILTARGITREVASGAFLRYREQLDLHAVLAFDPTIRARGESAVTVTVQRIERAPGVIMRRWAVPDAEPLITAEFRPDWPIWSGEPVYAHRHNPSTTKGHVNRSKTTGAGVRRAMTDAQYEAHLKKFAAILPDVVGHTEDGRDVRGDASADLAFGADHFGADTPARHCHVKVAKYLFAATPTLTSVPPGAPHVHAAGHHVADDGHVHTLNAFFLADENHSLVHPGTPHAHVPYDHDVNRRYRVSVDDLSSKEREDFERSLAMHLYYRHSKVRYFESEEKAQAWLDKEMDAGAKKVYERPLTFEEDDVRALRSGLGLSDDINPDSALGRALASGRIRIGRYDPAGPAPRIRSVLAELRRTPSGRFKARVADGIYAEQNEEGGNFYDKPVVALQRDWGDGQLNIDTEEHLHREPAKDTSEALARRLSIHPMSRERLASAERVFFLLEGCLKEASVVSAGEVTFSCPSVTLWNAPELPDFATKHLAGKRVYVVSDSDWDRPHDDGVIRQLLSATDRLRSLGVEAHATAPPPPSFAGCTDVKHLKDNKHGIDDHLSRCTNGGMDDLVVVRRAIPYGISEWMADHPKPGERPRIDGRRRDEIVLRWLVMHASEHGVSTVPLKTVARYLQPLLGSTSEEGARKAVERAILSLGARGALEITEPLAVRRSSRRYRKDYEDWGGEVVITHWLRAETIRIPLAEEAG